MGESFFLVLVFFLSCQSTGVLPFDMIYNNGNGIMMCVCVCMCFYDENFFIFYDDDDYGLQA